ncbi:MAG: 3D domain-containing protein [Syntrophotaleaceae bacterium]
MGYPLTPERSLAVDPAAIPLGAPVFIASTWPYSSRPLQRLMVAQDTGGAIKGGAGRLFWGLGNEAGAMAGRMKQEGRLWVLLPRTK